MKTTATDVTLYYPNLVGYLRIIFLFLAIRKGSQAIEIQCTSTAIQALIYYLISFGGDLIDGYLARLFDQTSTYGGVLDMITDRMATAGLITLNCVIYPTKTFMFSLAMMLDITSHWWHMLSTQGHHHKSQITTYSDDPLFIKSIQTMINSYYGIYPLFAYCRVSAELYWVVLYALNFTSTWVSWNWLLELSCKTFLKWGCILKNVINVAQLILAAFRMAAEDAENAVESYNTATSKTKSRRSSSTHALSPLSPLSPETAERRSPRLSGRNNNKKTA